MSTLRDLQAKVFDRINPAVRFSVTRYVLSIGFFVAVVALGLIFTMNLGVDLLPTVNIPVVVVNTVFPGASPGVVEQQVSQIIENAVSTISGITVIKSTSVLGASHRRVCRTIPHAVFPWAGGGGFFLSPGGCPFPDGPSCVHP